MLRGGFDQLLDPGADLAKDCGEAEEQRRWSAPGQAWLVSHGAQKPVAIRLGGQENFLEGQARTGGKFQCFSRGLSNQVTLATLSTLNQQTTGATHSPVAFEEVMASTHWVTNIVQSTDDNAAFPRLCPLPPHVINKCTVKAAVCAPET